MDIPALLIHRNVTFLKDYSGKLTTYSARGGGLANFLDSFTDLDDINHGIKNVQYYIDGGIFDYNHNTVSTPIFTAWLDNKTADIYPSTGNTEMLLQTVPLEEFKAILVAWRSFLQGD
jgi:hypothetical protein